MQLLAALEVAWAAIEAGVHFLLMFPRSSLMSQFGPVTELLGCSRVVTATTDFCAWGSPFRRSITMVTNFVRLRELQIRITCANGHQESGPPTNAGPPLVTLPARLCTAIARSLRRRIEDGVREMKARIGDVPKPPRAHFHEAGLNWRKPEQWKLVFKGL